MCPNRKGVKNNLVGMESSGLLASPSSGQYYPAAIIASTGVIVGVTIDIQGDLIHRKGSQSSVVIARDKPASVRLTLPGLATAQLDSCFIVNDARIPPRQFRLGLSLEHHIEHKGYRRNHTPLKAQARNVEHVIVVRKDEVIAGGFNINRPLSIFRLRGANLYLRRKKTHQDRNTNPKP